MKKKGYLWVLICGVGIMLLGGYQNLLAQVKEAEAFALNWFNEQPEKLKTNSTLSAFKSLPSDYPDLYLAEFSPQGFLIYFFGDDHEEIIAYSTEGTFPESSDHPLITEWIPAIKPSLNSTFKSTTGMTYMQDTHVEPLVRATWGQGSPWNKFCPSDDQGRFAQVGCVAVAMGQLMKKWNWPLIGVGANSYTPVNHPEYGVQSASFDTAYQWEGMHFVYPSDESALLLYHAGVATFMNYGPNESGANTSVYAIQALKTNFLYYKGMQLREKERYLEKDWFKMLRQELINGRPLIYIGSNPDGGIGHAFNIDGFHSQNYFHFNWGWNGAGNGFFRLENMAAGGGNFTKGQAAIFWIQPDYIPMRDRPGSFQTLPGNNFVQLLWDKLVINDFSHYNIYRDGELIATPITNQYRDEGLVNGINYTYHITASYIGEIEGESASTENLQATPLPSLLLPFINGFENNPTDWELQNSDMGFHWGAAANLNIPGNNGHIISIRSDLADKSTQVSDYLISPGIDLRNMDHVAISFDYVFKQKPGVDHLFLMYRRYDNGLWHPISQLDSTGNWDNWETKYYYFPEDAKQSPIQIGFYYNDYNGQGYGAALDNIRIWQIEEPPTPEYRIDDTNACQYQMLTFTSESHGEVYDWYWDFGEDAEPRYAYSEGPHEVYYNYEGYKNTSLLLNHLDLIQKVNQVNVTLEPISGFDHSLNGLLVNFSDTSKYGNMYWWDFGDGQSSTERNPQNKFREFEVFTVTQVVYNDHCDPDTSRIALDLRINSAIHADFSENGLVVFPNPASDKIHITFLQMPSELLNLRVIDLQGRVVLEEQQAINLENHLDISTLKPGVFFLQIRFTNKVYLKKILIE